MRYVFFYFLILAVLLGLSKKRYEFTDKNCIAAIVGEYAQNDLYGMKLIAHAIRKRGTLRGVYGLYAKHSKYERGYIWVLAKQAWEESANEPDPIGADSWYSGEDIDKHGIPNGKSLIFVYRNTYFFKTTNKRR